MKHFEFIQNTDAWMKARGGLATTSSFGKIITPTGKKSGQMDSYANQIVAELLLNKSCDRDLSNIWAIQWGNEWEGKASDLYQFETGYDIEHGGFYTDDDFKIGASPDVIVMQGEEKIGLAEIKCPENPVKHVEFLFKNEINKIYKPQLFGQMLITGFDWVDYFSFYPEMPHVKIRTQKSDDMIFYNELKGLLDEFSDLVQEKLQSLVSCGHINEIPFKNIEALKQKTKNVIPDDIIMAG